MLLLEQIEDTTLFDAGLAVDIAESLINDDLDHTLESIDETVETQSVSELVVIDSNVANSEAFITDRAGVEYYVIDSNENLDSLSAKISSFSGLNSIHIISHGSIGEIELAGEIINSQTSQNHTNFFSALKNSLNENGDLLLYGCNIGENLEGMEFVNKAALLSGADVAASNDLSSSEELGGNWELEVKAGEIETEEIVPENYESSLRTFRYNVGQQLCVYNGHGSASDNIVTFISGDPSIFQRVDKGNDVCIRAIGEGTVTLRFSGGGQDTEVDTFIFTIPNQIPTGQDQEIIVNEDSPYQFTEEDFSSGYSDPDNDPFTAIKVESLPDGSLELNGNSINSGDVISVADIHQLEYKGLENVFGENADSFQFSVGDGRAFSSALNMTVDINGINDAPIIRPGSVADTGIAGATETVAEDHSLILNLSDYVLDIEGDSLLLNGHGSALNGTVSDNGDGTVTYTPDENYFGPDSLSLKVSDGEFDLDVEIPVTVTPVNDAPVLVQDEAITEFNTAIIIDPINNDFDIENDPLTISRIISVENGSTTIKNNLIEFIPNDNFNGTASIVYEITDGQDSSTSSISIEVQKPTDFVDSSWETESLDFNSVQTDFDSEHSNSTASIEPLISNDGEYSIKLSRDSENSSSVRHTESMSVTDGEYSILSLNEIPLNLHEIPTELISPNNMKSAIQALISQL